jgi:hypothetical protein
VLACHLWRLRGEKISRSISDWWLELFIVGYKINLNGLNLTFLHKL